jgi:hypothetical protein
VSFGKRIKAASASYRSAVACCSHIEFSAVCSLIYAALVGLYPRCSRTAIFDVRVRIMARIQKLMTTVNSTILLRQQFLMQNSGLIQLSFLEYVNNFIPDYMPCECQFVHVQNQHSSMHENKSILLYTTICDQFRERTISCGNERWEHLETSAVLQLDKLVRNSSKLPVNHSTKLFGTTNVASSLLTTNANKAASMHVIRVPKEPLAECMYSMHTCKSNNLQELYEFDSQISSYKHQIPNVHLLHKRLVISWLPMCVANEQRASLERQYGYCLIQQTSARIFYVCSSCVIAGKPIPLKPAMRYNLKKKQFFWPS